jgi:hypothetical protein
MTVFETLKDVNVNGHTEKKNGLTYLSWAWAWAELLKRYPDSTYTVYENADGWCYHTDGRTAWVKTGVTVEGKEYIEMLPVMDFKNRSIPLDAITSMDVNKAIQRSLTKAVARHGLGLYIYAGEDLPEGEEEAPDPDAYHPGDKIEAPKGGWKFRDAMFAWTKRYGITPETFGKFRDALVGAGIVDKISGSQMTPEQFDALCIAITQNFGDQLKVTA